MSSPSNEEFQALAARVTAAEEKIAHANRQILRLVPVEGHGVIEQTAANTADIARLLGHKHISGGGPGGALPVLRGYDTEEEVPPGPGAIIRVDTGSFSICTVHPPGSDGGPYPRVLAVVGLGGGFHRIHPDTTVTEAVRIESGWDGDWGRVGIQPYGLPDQMSGRWPAAPLLPEEPDDG